MLDVLDPMPWADAVAAFLAGETFALPIVAEAGFWTAVPTAEVGETPRVIVSAPTLGDGELPSRNSRGPIPQVGVRVSVLAECEADDTDRARQLQALLIDLAVRVRTAAPTPALGLGRVRDIQFGDGTEELLSPDYLARDIYAAAVTFDFHAATGSRPSGA